MNLLIKILSQELSKFLSTNMISVIIPTYKNTKLLINSLQHNSKYLHGCEIIVINDDPNISIKKDLSRFENITLIENVNNLGFGESVNIGVKKSNGDYIMLLNSDVTLIDGSYQLAINHFKNNSDIFAVSFAQEEKNNSIVGKNIIYWQNGFIRHKKNNILNFGPNGWAEGGSCLVDRSKFLEIGGFDPIYSPFYWEDIDLSYNAWRHGYKILFDPKIRVIHHHESTINKYYSKNKIREIAFRNQLIFIWKNITDRKLLIENLKNIFPIALKGGLPFILGFLQALILIPKIISQKPKIYHSNNLISHIKITLP